MTSTQHDLSGTPFPGRPGYLTGTCGHAVAGSEWEAGYRTCERCPRGTDYYASGSGSSEDGADGKWPIPSSHYCDSGSCGICGDGSPEDGAAEASFLTVLVNQDSLATLRQDGSMVVMTGTEEGSGDLITFALPYTREGNLIAYDVSVNGLTTVQIQDLFVLTRRAPLQSDKPWPAPEPEKTVTLTVGRGEAARGTVLNRFAFLEGTDTEHGRVTRFRLPAAEALQAVITIQAQGVAEMTVPLSAVITPEAAG